MCSFSSARFGQGRRKCRGRFSTKSRPGRGADAELFEWASRDGQPADRGPRRRRSRPPRRPGTPWTRPSWTTCSPATVTSPRPGSPRTCTGAPPPRKTPAASPAGSSPSRTSSSASPPAPTWASSPTMRPSAPSGPSRSSSAAPAAPGAPSRDSPTSRSSSPTYPPPRNGASPNSTPSATSSADTPGNRPDSSPPDSSTSERSRSCRQGVAARGGALEMLAPVRQQRARPTHPDRKVQVNA